MNRRESPFAWYVVCVKSNFERTVSMELKSAGFDEFLPLYRSVRRWSDRMKEIEAPLFPGYVFARLDAANRRPVLRLPGVVDILGFGKQLAMVPDHEIDAVRRILSSSLNYGPWPFLRTGQAVRIGWGPLEGLEGIFVAAKGRYRLVVSIEILQRSVSVEVDRGSVRPMGNSGPWNLPEKGARAELSSLPN
jgi:transcription antitermination factor NusG